MDGQQEEAEYQRGSSMLEERRGRRNGWISI